MEIDGILPFIIKLGAAVVIRPHILKDKVTIVYCCNGEPYKDIKTVYCTNFRTKAKSILIHIFIYTSVLLAVGQYGQTAVVRNNP